MAGTITRHYVTVGSRQVHYRRTGSGPTVVLLHESALSSSSVVYLMEELARSFTVLALDTPGYGNSDPLPDAQPEIAEFAEGVRDTLDALGVERASVYGMHTGAQIALELAVRHPDRVSALMVDGLPLFDDDDERELLANYLPLFPPRSDGTHLLALWHRYRDQHIFWPWYGRSLETRMDADLPDADHLHEGVLDMLRAGDGYVVAYSAAFRYRAEPALERLTVPVAFVAREDDLLVDYLAKLPPTGEGVVNEVTPRHRPDHAVRLRELFEAFPQGTQAPPAPEPTPIEGRIWRDYADTPQGQLHVRRTGERGGRPLLLVHMSPGSGAGVEGLMRALAGSRPTIAFDTLGNGDSDKPSVGEMAIGDYAPVVIAALEDQGVGELDLYGTHTGALIAMELAIALGDRVGSVVLEGVTIFDPDEVDDILEHYFVSLAPEPDGTHLVRAWSCYRDVMLWWPWYHTKRNGIRWSAVPSPEYIHREVVELLKSGETYPVAYRAAFTYPTLERLPLVPQRALLCATPDDMLAAFCAEAADLAPAGQAALLPGSYADNAALIARFLDGEDVGADDPRLHRDRAVAGSTWLG
jgi:pimeloyl-ACP methyl ester carboxylesterase